MAHNHPTVTPSSNERQIEYDDSAHDAYMCSLRLALIRSGILDGGARRMSAFEAAESYFEQKDDGKVEIVGRSEENSYLDLTFNFDPGIFKNATKALLTEEQVIISGFQPGTGAGDARVWFDSFEFEVAGVELTTEDA